MVDYVIVGAGSAGCVLAARLTENPSTRVLLLEAGGSDARREIRIPAAWSKLFRSEVDWDYSTGPQPGLGGRRVYWPRGKTLDGSSSVNTMMAIPGHRADYDGWADLGNEGWSFDEPAPQFRRCTRRSMSRSCAIRTRSRTRSSRPRSRPASPAPGASGRPTSRACG